MSAFIHVCSRLLAFVWVFTSALACFCHRLSALICSCSHLLTPPFVAPPLRASGFGSKSFVQTLQSLFFSCVDFLFVDFRRMFRRFTILGGSPKGWFPKGGFGGCSVDPPKPERGYKKRNDGHQKLETEGDNPPRGSLRRFAAQRGS